MSPEEINEIARFFTNSHKLKVDQKILAWRGQRWVWPAGLRTLKLRKAKSNFNDFWVEVVKNGYGHLVHETLKSSE